MGVAQRRARPDPVRCTNRVDECSDSRIGHNIVFQPLTAANRPAGKFEIFADGFAGRMPLANPTDAVARPGGLGQGPDGSLYVTEDVKGRIWRIQYKGK
ncbi:MAG: hypothetical protein HY047_00265 [Acidobacteria bacterium]|nr:hypothetical protein [Acidobacteriota bacterium]